MSGPSGERCADCYFGEVWNSDEEDDPLFCRRFPPSDLRVNVREAPFPITVGEDSWCGEFKRKPTK